MTNEETIEIIKIARSEIEWEYPMDYAAAFDKAIEALEQEPCEDAISRNAVTRVLNNMDRYVADELKLCDTCKKFPANEVFVVDDVYEEIVESLPFVHPKPKTGHWIPVSERLPEKNMACLVAVGRFNFTQIAVYSDLMGTIDHQIFYQGEVGHDNFKNITQYVKAWMPLPETYKAESEDKG